MIVKVAKIAEIRKVTDDAKNNKTATAAEIAKCP